MPKTILHCDLNNFYASVECLYNPEIRNSPVAVCGSQSTRHGIVLAKNSLAKAYEVKTGEAIWEAKRKCPGLVVVRPNYPLYLRYSMLARRIYEHYTNQVEAFGIDENWLDVTESTKLFGNGEKIANEIRQKIKFELGVTISVGVSYNKIFSKLASDMKKPDAVTIITEDNFKEMVWKLPVGDMLYVGRSTRQKLNKLCIFTIGDLANSSPEFLTRQLGVWGQTLWLFANGYDELPVMKTNDESIIKGIGNSLTTPRDLKSNEEIKYLIYVLSESVGERLRRHNLKGRTVQISIRDNGLGVIERQAPLSRNTYVTTDIAEKAYEIFLNNWKWEKTVRSLGVRTTNLVTADTLIQLSLFEEDSKNIKKELLDRSIDRIRERFGHYSVQRALMLKSPDLNANPIEENVIYPVSIFRTSSVANVANASSVVNAANN